MYRFAVNKVVCCPQNKTAWDKASVKLNCTQDDSRVNRYHCLPNRQKSALLEFCYDQFSGRYEKEHCIHLAESGFLNTDSSSCISFKNGCPTKTYLGDEIYQYPACLQINPHDKCYIADPSCPNISRETTTTYITTTDSQETVTSFNTNTTEIYNQPDVNVAVPIYVGLIAFIPIIVLILLILRSARLYMRDKKDMDDEETYPMLEKHPSENTTVVQDSIPIELRNMEEKDQKSFLAQLAKGNQTIFHARGMLIGCGGSGKTTLFERLKNEDMSTEEIEKLGIESTVGADVQTDAFIVDVKEETIIWNKTKETSYFKLPLKLSSEENDEIASSMIINEENKSNVTGNDNDVNQIICETDEEIDACTAVPNEENSEKKHSVKDSDKDQVLFALIGKFSTNGSLNPTNGKSAEIIHPHSDIDEKQLPAIESKELNNPVASRDVIESVSEKDEINMLEVVKDTFSTSSERLKLVSLMDFAGQCTYYPCHQLHMNPRSFYIMCVNMAMNLDDVVTNDDSNQKGTAFEGKTYRDYGNFWMKSLCSYGAIPCEVPKTIKEKLSYPLIVVATRSDKAKQDPKSYMQTLCKSLQPKFDFDKFFTLGFFNREDNKVQVSEIKKCIARTIINQPHWGESLPRSYVFFEGQIRHAKETSQKIFRMHDIERINNELDSTLRMKTEDLKTMLQFFHNIGLVLYFKDIIPADTVILDIQWFVDAFKFIIMDKKHIPEENRNIFLEWEHIFCETGELPDALLDSIWRIQENKKLMQHKSILLKFMERLGMLVTMTVTNNKKESESGVWHYVPCMNKRKFEGKCIEELSTKCSILCFQFDVLPNFIYYQLIVSCLSSPEWKLDERCQNKQYEHEEKESTTQRCLYSTAAIFQFKENCFVAVGVCKQDIEVKILTLQDEEVNDNIREEVAGFLEERVNEITKLSHMMVGYKIGYKCEETVFCDEGSKGNSFYPEDMLSEKKEYSKSPICICEKKHRYDPAKLVWKKSVHGQNKILKNSLTSSEMLTSDMMTSTQTSTSTNVSQSAAMTSVQTPQSVPVTSTEIPQPAIVTSSRRNLSQISQEKTLIMKNYCNLHEPNWNMMRNLVFPLSVKTNSYLY